MSGEEPLSTFEKLMHAGDGFVTLQGGALVIAFGTAAIASAKFFLGRASFSGTLAYLGGVATFGLALFQGFAQNLIAPLWNSLLPIINGLLEKIQPDMDPLEPMKTLMNMENYWQHLALVMASGVLFAVTAFSKSDDVSVNKRDLHDLVTMFRGSNDEDEYERGGPVINLERGRGYEVISERRRPYTMA